MAETATAIARVPLAAQDNLAIMGQRLHVDPVALQGVLLATVFKDASREEFAALVLVANAYKLNPLLKEIYAFRDKRTQAIVPIVSIDGWVRIINEHPAFDGMEFEDVVDEKGNFIGMECTIYRKDRNRPIKVIEWLSECIQDTIPWKKVPRRMNRHRSLIQCGRYAFGFSGIYAEGDPEALQVQSDLQRDAARSVAPMRQVESAEAAKGAIDADAFVRNAGASTTSIVDGDRAVEVEEQAASKATAEDVRSLYSAEPEDEGEFGDDDEVVDAETGEVTQAETAPVSDPEPTKAESAAELPEERPTEINGLPVPQTDEQWSTYINGVVSLIKTKNDKGVLTKLQNKHMPVVNLAPDALRGLVDGALEAKLSDLARY